MKGQLKSSFSIDSILGSKSSEVTVSSSVAVITSHTDRIPSHQQGSPYVQGNMSLPQPSSTVQDTPPSTPPTPSHVPGEPRMVGSFSPQTGFPRPSNRSPRDPEKDTSSPSPTYRKNGRMNYSTRQIARLEAVYQANPYPDSDVYDILSDELNLPAKKLKVWFQNKRARNKRRVSDVPAVHPVYMSQVPGLPMTTGHPVAQGLPPMPSFPYLMSGLMMSQPSVMMTPPTSPVDAHTMLHPYMAYTPVPYAQPSSTSGSP